MMPNALVIGGTGTLGKLLAEILHIEKFRVTIFSRDEFKQSHMEKEFPEYDYKLGNIRDFGDLEECCHDYDFVFHCAALKHVDLGESETEQFIKTNLLGTMNVSKFARDIEAKLIFFSTDKAVLPINAYGMTKSLAEKYLLSNHFEDLLIYRWGNILGSRGSIVQHFVNRFKRGQPIPITHEGMTRFWLNIEDAVDYVVRNLNHPGPEIMIPDVKGAPVVMLADCIAEIMGITSYQKEIVGIRPGEKIHECLYSCHDSCLRSDTCEQFTKEELIKKIEPLVKSCE